jgi:hypothetical protein
MNTSHKKRDTTTTTRSLTIKNIMFERTYFDQEIMFYLIK